MSTALFRTSCWGAAQGCYASHLPGDVKVRVLKSGNIHPSTLQLVHSVRPLGIAEGIHFLAMHQPIISSWHRQWGGGGD